MNQPLRDMQIVYHIKIYAPFTAMTLHYKDVNASRAYKRSISVEWKCITLENSIKMADIIMMGLLCGKYRFYTRAFYFMCILNTPQIWTLFADVLVVFYFRKIFAAFHLFFEFRIEGAFNKVEIIYVYRLIRSEKKTKFSKRSTVIKFQYHNGTSNTQHNWKFAL